MHPPILRVVSAISVKSVLIEYTELNIESNNKRFDSYGARNSVLIISHIASRDCRVHFPSDNLSGAPNDRFL